MKLYSEAIVRIRILELDKDFTKDDLEPFYYSRVNKTLMRLKKSFRYKDILPCREFPSYIDVNESFYTLYKDNTIKIKTKEYINK